MVIVGWVLTGLLLAYEWVLICRAVLSWIQVFNPRWTPHGLLLVVFEAIYTITDPPLRFLRKFMRPLRLGNIQVDMAFMLLFILVILCLRVVQWVFV
ncbi:MAG: YggT family protein [Propionibacteriaceae bacterium]|nr:YggT family protein [Propionibacteriaceae bacterium]